MSDTPNPPRLRFKFALLGAIGAAMILLPLGQVLHYQNADIEALVAERATLDPLTQTVTLQRHLLGHRDVADRVLRGRKQLEDEQRLRQADVDAALWTLRGTLSSGYWLRALNESSHLTADWRNLARRVALRQISAQENQDSHQLLIEQAVQIMDLVGALASPGSPADPAQVHAQVQGQVQVHRWLAEARSAQASQRLALESEMQAHANSLRAREADLRSQRGLIVMALVSLATLVALGVALLLIGKRQAVTPPPQPHGDSDRKDDTRRNSGRRATDFSALDTRPQPVLDRLRRGAQDTIPAEPLPPPH